MRHSLLPVAIVVMMAGVAEAAETGALRGTVAAKNDDCIEL